MMYRLASVIEVRRIIFLYRKWLSESSAEVAIQDINHLSYANFKNLDLLYYRSAL